MSNYIDTADGTAKADDIKLGEIAYSKGQRLVGTQEMYVQGTTLYVPEGWITVHVTGE